MSKIATISYGVLIAGVSSGVILTGAYLRSLTPQEQIIENVEIQSEIESPEAILKEDSTEIQVGDTIFYKEEPKPIQPKSSILIVESQKMEEQREQQNSFNEFVEQQPTGFGIGDVGEQTVEQQIVLTMNDSILIGTAFGSGSVSSSY